MTDDRWIAENHYPRLEAEIRTWQQMQDSPDQEDRDEDDETE